MSVTLFKAGESILVPPLQIHAHLGNGYFLTSEESLGEDVPDAENDIDETDEVEETNKDIVEESQEDEMSDEDVRLIGKELGISHWHNTNIDKLKVKIEEKQRGDSE